MRTLIVSNRLPVTTQEEDGRVRLGPSSGGLATALRSLQNGSELRWIGWPGDVSRVPPEDRAALAAELSELGTVPVYLSQSEISRYCDRFSNGVLWPLCHYLLDRVRVDAHRDWIAYREVNARFAAAVVEQYEPGDLIWVHDYQLSLVPALVRRLAPEARIGFFLHIPFPAADVFRILPWREELLRGMLGADVVGFHTPAYGEHFKHTVAAVLGAEGAERRVRYEGRNVRVNAYPIGVDVASFEAMARSEPIEQEVARVRGLAPGKKIVLGVDRLDYTNGVLRRVSAIERLLEREPAVRDTLHFIQIAVPTREHVDGYLQYRRSVNELVTRVNGEFGTSTSVPIHLLHRAIGPDELTALYCAADVMLVTPLRDGMNLVAKEYVASRVDEQGVLVISEFAGAASELREALQINPYDLDAMATVIQRGLDMDSVEQRRRMQALRAAVASNDVRRWGESFLRDLSAEAPARPSVVPENGEALVARAVAALRSARQLTLLLDYDGTLVPFAPTPPLAAPDAELMELIVQLARRANTRVHLVSGRPRDVLENWFGALPIGLHAEHGYWSRWEPGAAWNPAGTSRHTWKQEVLAIFTELTERTPGSLLEEKTSSVAWHYRLTEPVLAQARVQEAAIRLAGASSRKEFDVVPGACVLEARKRGIHKGRVVAPILGQTGADGVLAAGDDTTDEDLFAALPGEAVAIRVGMGPSRAEHRVATPTVLRRMLRLLLPPERQS